MFEKIERFIEQQKQQPGAQPTSRDYSGEFQKLSNDIDTLGGKLDRLIQILEPKPQKVEVATLDASGRTFDTNGYKYFGIFVSSSTTITIAFNGVSASINLVPGFNAVDMFQGSTITTSASTQVGLVWYDNLR